MEGTQGSRLPLPPCAQGPTGRLSILLPLLVNSLFGTFPDSLSPFQAGEGHARGKEWLTGIELLPRARWCLRHLPGPSPWVLPADLRSWSHCLHLTKETEALWWELNQVHAASRCPRPLRTRVFWLQSSGSYAMGRTPGSQALEETGFQGELAFPEGSWCLSSSSSLFLLIVS